MVMVLVRIFVFSLSKYYKTTMAMVNDDYFFYFKDVFI